jgi:hypothetical protein
MSNCVAKFGNYEGKFGNLNRRENWLAKFVNCEEKFGNSNEMENQI